MRNISYKDEDGKQTQRKWAESTGHFQKGKEHGHWVSRYEKEDIVDGPYRAVEGSYVDGKRHGEWIEGYSVRDKSKGRYVNGEKEGTWLNYDEGECWSITHHKDGEISVGEVNKERCRQAGLIP